MRSPRSLPYSRLNSPSSPGLSSQQRGSSPRIIAGASSGPAPTASGLSCAEGPRAGRRTPVGSHQSGAEGQNPLPHLLSTLLGMQQWCAVLLVCVFWFNTATSIWEKHKEIPLASQHPLFLMEVISPLSQGGHGQLSSCKPSYAGAVLEGLLCHLIHGMELRFSTNREQRCWLC